MAERIVAEVCPLCKVRREPGQAYRVIAHDHRGVAPAVVKAHLGCVLQFGWLGRIEVVYTDADWVRLFPDDNSLLATGGGL